MPTNVDDANNLIQMLKLQDELVFTLIPHKKTEDVILSKNRNFQKMKVNRAHKILNPEVSAALYFLADRHSKPEYETTAWFVGNLAKWYRLMTSRNLQNAISKFSIEKYEETIYFLEEMVDLMGRIRIGEAGIFKLRQKGFMLSITFALELGEYLLNKEGLKFVLTSRFTQDVIDNFFSVIRSKYVTPNVLQFKYDLRLISIAQYSKFIHSSTFNYD